MEKLESVYMNYYCRICGKELQFDNSYIYANSCWERYYCTTLHYCWDVIERG